MGAHTPAPWSVCGADGCTCKAVLYRDGVICEVKDFNDDMADASGHAPPPDEAQANKRLIAAAPDLLGALTLSADFLRQVNEMMRRIRAAARTAGVISDIPYAEIEEMMVAARQGEVVARAAISKAGGR